MDRIPFGIRQFDTTINGGAPAGSVVLLTGEAGAGSREFMYTSALINALAHSDEELHDLYYGDLPDDTVLPEEIHYVSMTAGRGELATEMRLTMDDEIIDSALDSLQFHDLSGRYFHMSPVPRTWYASRTPSIKDLRADHEREGLLGALGTKLNEVAPNNLVIIDSLGDLVGAMGDEIEWHDINYLVKGLQKASHEWNGLLLVHVNSETLSDTRIGQLVDATSGAMSFEWESGGSTRARTLIVRQFRGVLSQIEDENIVRFETEIGDAGFDISDVRKIR